MSETMQQKKKKKKDGWIGLVHLHVHAHAQYNIEMNYFPCAISELISNITMVF